VTFISSYHGPGQYLLQSTQIIKLHLQSCIFLAMRFVHCRCFITALLARVSDFFFSCKAKYNWM